MWIFVRLQSIFPAPCKKRRTAELLLILFLVTGISVPAQQDQEIKRLIRGELQMTFPSVYFRHNSADYATMPYTTDSCFKYIAAHIKDINSLVIWRDSSETERLTNKRIRKLKGALKKYAPSEKVNIQSMGTAQKISGHTIRQAVNAQQTRYLRSLNSVFDVSGAVVPDRTAKGWKKKPHTEHPRIWCMNCWRRHRFSKEYRLHLKQLRSKERGSGS